MSEMKDVQVKALEWNEYNIGQLRAFTPFGTYWVSLRDNKWTLGDDKEWQKGSIREVEMDYEQRIISLLEPAPKPAGGEWVTVPREPTPEMTSKGDCCLPQFSEEADGDDVANEVYRAMISAAPPAPAASPSGGEVVVKPLKWRDHGPNAFPAHFWSGETPFGRYEIEEECASDSPRYRLEWHSRLIVDEDSLPAAQEAAQADFEQRIRSALTSPEAPQASEVVRKLVECLRWFINDIDSKHTVMLDFDANVAKSRAALAKIRGDHE